MGTGLLFGLGASLSCLGVCLPIFLPYVMEKDKTFKEGLSTSLLFSLGRLIIYIGLGVAIFIIGSAVKEDAPEDWLRGAVAILGLVVILYGAWIVFDLPRPKWCPSKLAKNFSHLFSIILGVLIGSFFCPLLWATLVLAVAVSGDFATMLLSVLSFWAGSSLMIIAAGTITGKMGGRSKRKIGVEKIRFICGLVLIMAGAFYLISGLT